MDLVEKFGAEVKRVGRGQPTSMDGAEHVMAHRRLDRPTIGKPREPVTKVAMARPAIGDHAGAILGDQFCGWPQRLAMEAVLVFREHRRVGDIEAAEVKKYQPLTIRSSEPLRVALDASVREIPIGDIVARMAENVTARDEARREIHPVLIGEEMAGDIHPALRETARRPPFEQMPRLLVVAERKNAKDFMVHHPHNFYWDL